MAISLSIAEVGARGDGIATHEGNRYFVPFALAGETVEIEPGVRRGEGMAATLLRIVTPSPERQTPPCPHFTVCGGCALQHWLGKPYAAWKSGLIARALSQSGVTAPAFEPGLVGLPRERRRADFVLRRQGKRVLAGFHERGSHHVVDVESCPVITPRLEALLGSLRTTGSSFLADGGAADAVVNDTESGLDLLLRPHARSEPPLAAREALVALAETADLARLSWGGKGDPETIALRRPPMMTFGDASVELPPGAFLQATRQAEQAMRGAIAAWVGDAKRAADLFAGIGTLSLGQFRRLSLYESDREAVAAVDEAARLLGGGKATATRRDLFRNPLAAGDLAVFDAVLLDPPRAGAAAQAVELARSTVPRIVYASCDPGSFARDARTLQDGGYRLEKLMPIDQFLWSAHVELIALFTRAPLRSDQKSRRK
jgi:23S rRNA (uracil1939-C5)-methyltransferase